MAETVQFYLEQMVPELEDLEQKNIFNKPEIKSIIKRRTNFEYALKRMQSQKIDFLRYIEYEMNLEQLRKTRKKRLKVKGKTTISDYAIPRRIYHIFDRALNKFKGDLGLWLQYIEFAKSSNSGKLLSKIFASALQLHPTKPPLWILAAQWEFERNTNIIAARVLMERGLRLNPTSKQLWHEYFKLELIYVAKIKARREILGISATSEETTDEVKPDEFDEETMLKLPKITGQEFLAHEMAKAGEKIKKEGFLQIKNNDKLMTGELAKIAFNHAIKAIPNDLSFRQKFIDIYKQFSDTFVGQEEVYQSIRQDFSDNTRARVYFAERHLSYISDEEAPEFVDAVNKSIAEFQKCLEELANTEVWYLYTQFLNENLKKTSQSNLRDLFSTELHKAYKTAENLQLISDRMYSNWADLILSNSDADSTRVEKVQSILLKGTLNFPQNPELWIKRISNMELTINEPHNTQLLLYAEALKLNPNSLYLWDSYISWTLASWSEEHFNDEELDKRLMISMLKVSSISNSSIIGNLSEIIELKNLVADRYLTWAVKQGGINKARKVYESLLSQIIPTEGFYQICIELEEDQFQPSSPASSFTFNRITWLYDQAVQIGNAEKTRDLWLSYIQFLLNGKQFSKATEIYSKALKKINFWDIKNAFGLLLFCKGIIRDSYTIFENFKPL
ncbi:hypothetical protein G9A89_015008 [Geosiphon pyriformis]|nr:hypothetical protein G9A89_015008 [Geosiphon pyriformis]